MPERYKIHPSKWAWEYVSFAICLLLFFGLNVWYVTWDVNSSQHNFCQVITTINKAPIPSEKGVTKKSNPARAYDIQLAKAFRALQKDLGC